MELFGKIIKLFRKNLYLTQVELADRTGITPEYLSKIENGNKIPSMELMKDLCSVIDIPLSLVLLLSIDEKELDNDENKLILTPLLESILSKLFSEDQFDITAIDKTIEMLKSIQKNTKKAPAA